MDFRCIEVRVARRELVDLVVALTWEAGCSGVEEREERVAGESVTCLLVYAPAPKAEAVREAAWRAVGCNGQVGAPEPVAAVDWGEGWKRGLAPVVVSPRLVVRPSCVEFELAPGQRELVIDPGQAFGTGGHGSTLLALQWLDALAQRAGGWLYPATCVLDVGAGTGVLALSALRLGAGRAVALDLDPLAAPESRRWAERAGLAERFRVFTGPLAALSGRCFDLVLANMLSGEVLPLAGDLAAATRPAGHVVISGLLAREREAAEAELSAAGLASRGARSLCDAAGDAWVSLLMARS